MTCLPDTRFLSWLTWLFQPLAPPKDDGDFWDNQEVPLELQAGGTACEPTNIQPPPLSPSRQAGIEINTRQSFGAPVLEGSIHITSTCTYWYAEPSFTDNANQPASTHSVRSSVSGATIILPNPSTPIDLRVPQKVATRSRTSELYMPVSRMSLEPVSFNPTAPLEKHRPRRSTRNCK
jgi:hypothetical protein